MRFKRFSNSLLGMFRAGVVMSLFVSVSVAEEAEVTEAKDPSSLVDVRATKVILQFTGRELQPAQLELGKADSSVFFVNKSGATPVDLVVDFRGKSIHCHTKNLKLDDSGFLRTITPIEPFDFAVLCFPVVGAYSFQVTEVTGAKKTFNGKVQISE